MSKYTMDQVWAPIEQRHANHLMHNTWGHLFPADMEHTVLGILRIAAGCYSNNIMILDEEIDIEGSPWWMSSLMEFINQYDFDDGEVWEIHIGVRVVSHIECIPVMWEYCVDGVQVDDLDPVSYVQKFEITERESRCLMVALT